MRNLIKIGIVSMIFVFYFLSNNVYAATSTVVIQTTPSCSGITEDANKFISEGENSYSTSGISGNDITSQVVPFVQMLTAAGILIIGACVVVLGIQWVLSKPSPEAQAKLKGKLIALAVAAAVMFGSFSIWSILVNILSAL